MTTPKARLHGFHQHAPTFVECASLVMGKSLRIAMGKSLRNLAITSLLTLYPNSGGKFLPNGSVGACNMISDHAPKTVLRVKHGHDLIIPMWRGMCKQWMHNIGGGPFERRLIQIEFKMAECSQVEIVVQGGVDSTEILVNAQSPLFYQRPVQPNAFAVCV